jgi:cytochrome c2
VLTAREQDRLIGMALVLALSGCKPPPEREQAMPIADPAHGLEVIRQTGCGACHEVPGLFWPKGRLGPNLDGFAERTVIAGELPNRPDILAQWVRNAPSLIPGTSMPAVPMTEEDARDVAAYLYTLRDR